MPHAAPPHAALPLTGLRVGLVILGLMILGLMGLGTAGAWAGPCRPPLKSADGTCVAACPAGYADRGRKCVYRNESH